MSQGTAWATGPAIGQRPWPAWSLSLLLHLVLLAGAAYLGRAVPRAVGSVEGDREVGVALVARDGDSREYLTREQAQQAAAATTAANEIQQALPTASDIAIDLSGLMPSTDDGSTAGAAARLPSAGTTGGLGRGNGLSNAVRTSIFGASGSGSKFVYVFDRSGSMAGFGGRPLAAAQRELIGSLQDLNDTTQFQIIFYNDEPHPFRFRSQTPRMVWGTDEAKDAAASFVGGIAATGSTRHWQALKIALGLRPDVIFFLTDADEPQMTDRELRQVQRFNASATIHAIEFGYGAQRNRSNFLVRLAEQNGGQHRYVDISGLASP